MTYAGHKARNHPLQVMRRGAVDTVDDRRTPQALFDALHKEFKFTIDIAASAENKMLPRFRAMHDVDITWPNERVWCNPPYSNLPWWISKVHGELLSSIPPQLVVMLLPSNRTDQPWWQTFVEPWRDRHRPDLPFLLQSRFLPGRIRFTRPGGGPLTKHDRPLFGCVLLIWRGRP